MDERLTEANSTTGMSESNIGSETSGARGGSAEGQLSSSGESTSEKQDPFAQVLKELHSASGKTSGHVSIDNTAEIPVDHDVFPKYLTLNSVKAENPEFDIKKDADGSRSLSNIKGLSVDFDAAGQHQRRPITGIKISSQPDGATRFDAQIESPLGVPVRQILGASDQLPISFTLDRSGKVNYPTGSQMLYGLSGAPGFTLPGLVASDYLKDAGSVAEFLEKHQDWTQAVLAPHVKDIKKKLEPAAEPAKEESKPNQASEQQKTENQQAAPGDKNKTEIQPVDKPKEEEKPPELDGMVRETLNIDGKDREYLLHVPPDYDKSKPLPLVVMLHGLGETGKDIARMFDGNKQADKHGYIIAYPDAYDWLGINGFNTWDTGNGLTQPGQNSQDVKFLNTIMDRVESKYSVDPKRVYMVGLSNGGMETFRAGSELSGRLAAIAVISGAMSGKEPKPSEPLSVLNIHGTADKVIPYEGLTDTPQVLTDVGVPTFKSTKDTSDYWKKTNGIAVPFTVKRDGDKTTRTATDPVTGETVEEHTMANGKHVPDEREPIMEDIWKFLKSHPRKDMPTPNDKEFHDIKKPIEEWTTVTQLTDALKKRGPLGLQGDADTIFDAVTKVPNGSISPAGVFDDVRKHLSFSFNDPVSDFIRTTNSISKSGEHIDISRNGPATIPLGMKFGPLEMKSVTVDNTSFDLSKENGYPDIENINGITFNARVPGLSLSSKIQGITEHPLGKDGSEGRLYRAQLSNPLPAPIKQLLSSPDSINVDVKVGPNGKPKTSDADHITQQLLSGNPVSSGLYYGATDVGDAIANPNLPNIAKVGGAAAGTAGLAYIGGHFSSKLGTSLASKIESSTSKTLMSKVGSKLSGKLGVAGALAGLVVAPMAVDLAHKAFDD